MGKRKHHSKWWVYALFYFLAEALVSLFIIAVGIWFEVRVYGTEISRHTQSLFAHLLLSYGCGVFLFGSFLACCVQQARLGYIFIILCNTVLGVISTGYGIGVLIKPKMFLAHGYVRHWYDLYNFLSIIIGVVCIVHGAWNWLFTFVTIFKLCKIRKARNAIKRQISRSRSRTIDLDRSDEDDGDFIPGMAVV